MRKRDLKRLLSRWQKGELSKREIDRNLGKSQFNGKYITQLWQTVLGVNTRKTNVRQQVTV